MEKTRVTEIQEWASKEPSNYKLCFSSYVKGRIYDEFIGWTCTIDLRRKLGVQEALAWATEMKASKIEKGIEAMLKTSRVAFTVSFNKCKLIVQAHFSGVDAESWHAPHCDDGLIIVVSDGIGMIIEDTKKHAYKVDATPLTRLIFVDDKDDNGIGLVLCIINGSPQDGAGPSLCITKSP